MRNRPEAITVKGFKTIGALENCKPRQLTALIGANGAGKSDFISFFRMMSRAMGPGQSAILHWAAGRGQQNPARRPVRNL